MAGAGLVLRAGQQVTLMLLLVNAVTSRRESGFREAPDLFRQGVKA